MRTQHLALATAFLLTVPLIAATSQDDARLGRDAPDAADLAAAIPLGEFTGTLDPDLGDLADWYFVCEYVGGVLKLVINVAGLEVQVNGLSLPTPLSLQLDACPGPLGILAKGSVAVPYDLRLVDAPASDFAVTTLAVRTVGAGLAAAASTTRQVDVAVANQGSLTDVFVLRVTVDELPFARTLHEEAIVLGAGESVSRTVAWSLADPVRRSTVRAAAEPEVDLSWENNALTWTAGVV